MERAYRHSSRLLGAAICLLGVALVMSAVARGGGPLAVGVVVGVAFALLGAARVYIAVRSGSSRGGT